MRILRSMLIGLLLCHPVFAQVENQASIPVIGIPDFFLDALTFQNNDSTTRLDLYVQIPYEVLRFVAEKNQFVARYEVTVNILGEGDRSIVERLWNEEERVPLFDQTLGRNAYSLTQRSLNVAAGEYKLRVQVRDLESRKSSAIVRSLTVPVYTSGTLSISDIMLVNQVTKEGAKSSIVPNVSGNMGDVPSGFYLFFEVYTPPAIDSVAATYQIFNKKNEEVFQKSEVYGVGSGRTQVIARIDSSRFPIGSYVISVVIDADPHHEDAPHLMISKRRNVILQWQNLPISINDLDLAIRQLRYIAQQQEFDEMSEATSFEEKQRLFQEFWKKRDPSPDTRRNEYLEEYYKRVEYANQHFSHYIEGWRTDMGMVFIIFGAPNNVDRHPFDYDSKPYEVWSYYDLNRQLVFVDETGFGDYRLITPIYDLIHRNK